MADKYEQYSKDDLIRLLRERDRKPRFGLVWERDEIDHDKSVNGDFVALDLDESLSCGAAPYRNLLIEGDNFDALRYLRMTHAGKVKCVYIDPPYNTGNKDFIYNDHFVDKDDLYKHSKWLEFLYRRLELARSLLAEDGVMLVSINDENRAKLELLLDEVFSRKRVGSLVWRTKDTGNDAGGNFSQVHEHVLIYANTGFKFLGKTLSLEKYRYQEGDDFYTLDPLTKAHSYKERLNTYYPIQDPRTGYWYPCDPERVWAYASETKISQKTKLRSDTIEELIRKNLVYFPSCSPKDTFIYRTMDELLAAIRSGAVPVLPKKKTPLLKEDLPDLEFWVGKIIASGRPSKKSFLKDKGSMIAPVSSWIAGLNEEVDYLYDDQQEDVELMRSPRGGEGSDAINEILGAKAFSHPKPPTLIRNILRQATSKDGVVVDFFAGSGTTAQAVLELNQEDGGTRKFILVSNSEATEQEAEKNICLNVCAKRVKGVIEGYRNTPGTGGEFAYLRTRRISAENIFSKIQHNQIWTALQLVHDVGVVAYQEKARIQVAEIESDEETLLLYVPKITDAAVNDIREATKKKEAIIYSWQPALLRERMTSKRLTFEQIPQYLVDRFGTGTKK